MITDRWYILDRQNRVVPVDMLTWAHWLESANKHRQVNRTTISQDVFVSTVFIGLDHRFSGDGPPLIFETLIFGGPLDGEMWRYSSWDDAETGHKAAVRKARAAQKART